MKREDLAKSLFISEYCLVGYLHLYKKSSGLSRHLAYPSSFLSYEELGV